MDSLFITAVIETIGGACAFFLGHIFGRKKSDAETEKIAAETERLRIANLNDTIKIYRQVHLELSDQLQILSKKCEALSLEIQELRGENALLKIELHKYNINIQKQSS